jgi:hypothetical protein
VADPADLAQADAERMGELARKREPYVLPAGPAGYCEGCGHHFDRLIDDKCGRCRDRLPKLNGNW